MKFHNKTFNKYYEFKLNILQDYMFISFLVLDRDRLVISCNQEFYLASPIYLDHNEMSDPNLRLSNVAWGQEVWQQVNKHPDNMMGEWVSFLSFLLISTLILIIGVGSKSVNKGALMYWHFVKICSIHCKMDDMNKLGQGWIFLYDKFSSYYFNKVNVNWSKCLNYIISSCKWCWLFILSFLTL